MSDSILLVDGDGISCETVRNSLQEAGFTVRVAKSESEAISQLSGGNVCMVICEQMIGDLSGTELCHRIRAGEFGGYVYVILLTEMGAIDQHVEGLVSGADDFLGKPFDSGELVARVNVGMKVLQLETPQALVFSLAKLAESRDPETGHHIERIQCYSRCLAEQLATIDQYTDTISSQFVQLIYQTSPLHDIGKIGVPDSILLKPGKLTDEEFLSVQKHPLIGAETLRDAIDRSPQAEFLKMAHDITLSHHEKYDGTGYPEGLSGDGIPLSARIVALADVYDALTTHRVYKDAYSHEKSKTIIIEGRGTQFDPDIVDAFLEIEQTFQAIRRRFDDDRFQQTQTPVTRESQALPVENYDLYGPAELPAIENSSI